MNRIAIIKEVDFMTSPERALADELLGEGRLDGARDVLANALTSLAGDEIDERVALRNLLCKVQRAAKNTDEALRLHLETYSLSQLAHYPILRFSFHNGLGITYEERREFGKALIEYEAARYFAEEAGDFESAGYVENNVGLILSELGRTEEAHEHLKTARGYFTDPIKLAEIDETTAQVFLKEEKPWEALSYALDASRTFLMQGQRALLSESLRTLMKAAADYTVAQK